MYNRPTAWGSGLSLSIGNDKMARRPRYNLENGFRSGKLSVIEPWTQHPKSGSHRYLCLCDCGYKKVVTASRLAKNVTVSCGCKINDVLVLRNTTHGMSKTPTYKIWKDMIKRCNNPNHKHFHNYGGRGIKVSKEWETFENFLNDVGIRPSKEHSIDRIDNNGNYEKGNVKWSTDHEQRRNKRTNVILDYNGQKMCITDVARINGIHPSLLHNRIKKGIPLEIAVKKERVSVKKLKLEESYESVV